MTTRVPMLGLTEPDILRARYRIANDVRALEGCRHEHLARPTDAVLDSHELWLVSEAGPTTTLAGVLAERGRVEPVQAARWGRDIADGLATAHAAGVVHGDLYADVVGVTENGAAVLTGFAVTVTTRDGLREGVPAYVAPEVARGAELSPAADIFALGALLVSAVQGRGPYPGTGDREALLRAAAAGAVIPPQRSDPLGGVLAHMLHPDPSRRPPAAAVRDLLAGASHQADGPAPPGPPPSPPAELCRRPGAEGVGWRRPLVVTAAFALLTLMIAVAVGLTMLGGSAHPDHSAPVTSPTPEPLINDPQTVDPCSLLTAESVAQFGSPVLYRDFQSFSTCLIELSQGDRGILQLRATFGAPMDFPVAGPVEKVGDLQISRESGDARDCYRTIILPDRHRVYVSAHAYDGARGDLCAIADAGTATAVTALSTRSLKNRAPIEPPNSLRYLDACSLVDAATLALIPAVDASHRDRGFAGWECNWGQNPAFSAPPRAAVWFWRSAPLTGELTHIAGRSAVVTPDPYADKSGTCLVELVHRSYTGESGNRRVETVGVEVFLGAEQSPEAACQATRTLAAAIAPRLPPGS